MASIWKDGDESPLDLNPRLDSASDDEVGRDDIQYQIKEGGEKEEQINSKKEKVIPVLSPYSRLLAPTRSWRGKEHAFYASPASSSSRALKRASTGSPPKRASTGSAINDSAESRYSQLTASRLAAVSRKKKEVVAVDPREQAWDATPLKPSDPALSEIVEANEYVEVAPYPTLYDPPKKFKGVKSKLHAPTTASVRKMRDYYSSDDSGQNSPGSPRSPGSPNKLHPRPFSPTRKVDPNKRPGSPRRSGSPVKHPVPSVDLSGVTSRLYDSTASRRAAIQSQKAKAEAPPEPPVPVIKKVTGPPPACAQKGTKAMEYGRREKFVSGRPSVIKKSISAAPAPPPPACYDKVTKAAERGRREKFDTGDPRDIGRQLRLFSRSESAPPLRPRTTSSASASSGVSSQASPPAPSPVQSPRSRLQKHQPTESAGDSPKQKSSPTDKRRAVDNSTLEWREKEAIPYATECLLEMRGFVPLEVQNSTAVELQGMGLQPPLALRLATKPCLWLVRETIDNILNLTPQDLTTRFDYSKQGLDIVELAAVYACLPSRFEPAKDVDGKKEKWRGTLEYQLKRLMKQKEYKSFPNELKRNSAYAGQEPIFTELLGPDTICSGVSGMV